MVGRLDGRRHVRGTVAIREHWPGGLMKNNIVQHDYAREIAASMQVIKGRTSGPVLTAAPETFDLYCVCAVHDKPYTLRFVRQPSGLLRFRESVKGQPASCPDNARSGGVGWKLLMEYFENGSTPCAWCGNGGFHHCARDCGALVCGGRMKGETFHCRKSCGASWVGVPLREVSGSVAKQSGPRRGSLSPAPDIAPHSAKPRLLLPAPLPDRRR
jgi:hypothetical protein